MNFRRIPLEEWFDQYQFEVKYDIGESGIKYFNLKTLGVELDNIPLRYGYHKGNPKLRERISEQYDSLTSENIAVTNGASEANFVLLCSIINAHDHLIVEHLNYPSNYEVPSSMNMNFDLLTLNFEDQFKLKMKKFEELV